MWIKAAPRTSLIQRVWVKCWRHISIECIQLYNWLGIPLSVPRAFYLFVNRLVFITMKTFKTKMFILVQYLESWFLMFLWCHSWRIWTFYYLQTDPHFITVGVLTNYKLGQFYPVQESVSLCKCRSRSLKSGPPVVCDMAESGDLLENVNYVPFLLLHTNQFTHT